MCRRTASRGMRRSAPISGGPNGDSSVATSVKILDESVWGMYRQNTLPSRTRGGVMLTSMREEIRIGQLAIRFLVEGTESEGTVAIFEFDVPVGAKMPVAHSHDAYEETIYGLEGVLTMTVDG